MNIKNNVKRLAASRNMKLIDVAKAMGIVPQRLNSILTGQASLASLQAVADAIGVELYEIFKDTEATPLICPHCGHTLHISLS